MATSRNVRSGYPLKPSILLYLAILAVAITAACGATKTSQSLVTPPASSPLTITTTSLPSGTENLGYSTTLAASGGQAPYTWSITSGSLPNGLTLTPSSGLIAGTPKASGTFSVTVQVTDSSSPAQTASQGFSIVIAAGGSTGGSTAAATYWGMDVNRPSDYPLLIPYGEMRLWDSPAQWPDLETCQASSGSPTDSCFTWISLDAILSKLYNAGITDVFCTLSRTPAWGSTNTSDANCNYYSLGAQYQGACYPPVDLNPDGTGANQIWKDWVSAIATRVNDPSYLQNHAHIKYWEIWNEFYRSATIENWASTPGNLSWQGTYNQLVRLAEDARCTITGTGVIHNVPSAGAVSSCTATAIDPNAQIVAPSTAANVTDGLDAIQNFLYCNHNPITTCSGGTAGATAVDIIDAHLYAQSETPETVVTNDIPHLQAVLQATEQQKPLWNGEGSWGPIPNSNSLWANDSYARAGFVPRFFALYWSAGVTGNFWYSYDTNDGQLFDPSTGLLLTPEATAWTTTYNWLVGAVPTQTPFCQTSGTIYFCDFRRANGYEDRLVWDSQFGQNCTQMSNPVICGDTTYSMPVQYNEDWVDVLGTVHPTSSTVVIGANPILLEGHQ
jgi:Putative Ig domain